MSHVHHECATCLSPITSIFQRRYEECNRGRPSPRAAFKLDHHVNRNEARTAQPTRALLSRMARTTLKGLLARLTIAPVANGAQTNTQTQIYQNTATPDKTLLRVLTNQYRTQSGETGTFHSR